MKCPYSDKECKQTFTSAITRDINCIDCPDYGKGIRFTGALPDINFSRLMELIRKLKPKRKK